MYLGMSPKSANIVLLVITLSFMGSSAASSIGCSPRSYRFGGEDEQSGGNWDELVAEEDYGYADPTPISDPGVQPGPIPHPDTLFSSFVGDYVSTPNEIGSR
ncbi:unnamed protein product [Victoria cruziana]